jgi:hypothetical protein
MFPKAVRTRLKVEMSILSSLGLDMRLLKLNDRTRSAKLFVEGAQSAWECVFEELGCFSCGPTSPLLWLLDLLDESREMKVWIPRAFVKRMWQLQTRRLIWYCKCGERIKLSLYADLPLDFQKCAEHMNWKYQIIRTWDRRYIKLDRVDGENFYEEGEDLSEFVTAAIKAWRYVMSEEYEGTEYPGVTACEIVNKINESNCGVTLSKDPYLEECWVLSDWFALTRRMTG